jgi:hypothetical protein
MRRNPAFDLLYNGALSLDWQTLSVGEPEEIAMLEQLDKLVFPRFDNDDVGRRVTKCCVWPD